MIKKTTYIFIILYFINIGSLFALNSSSYLVSKMAFELSDFETASSKFEISNEFSVSHFRDQMITLVILGDYSIANNISLNILKIDPDDQEANLVNYTYSLINNSKEDDFIFKFKKNQNEFINFIFFENKKLKTFKQISNTFIEIVQSNYYDLVNLNNINYNFLLFYLSLSSYFESDNDKAFFLKAQTYQMMKNHDKAIYFYKKIKPSSSFFKDAQYYIAANYENSLSFIEAEKKI